MRTNDTTEAYICFGIAVLIHAVLPGLDLLSARITDINGVPTDIAAAPAPSAVQARDTHPPVSCDIADGAFKPYNTEFVSCTHANKLVVLCVGGQLPAGARGRAFGGCDVGCGRERCAAGGCHSRDERQYA